MPCWAIPMHFDPMFLIVIEPNGIGIVQQGIGMAQQGIGLA